MQSQSCNAATYSSPGERDEETQPWPGMSPFNTVKPSWRKMTEALLSSEGKLCITKKLKTEEKLKIESTFLLQNLFLKNFCSYLKEACIMTRDTLANADK